MSKIAIVTDSNSGITQAQAKEMDVSVLPMPFMIDEEYYSVAAGILRKINGRLGGGHKPADARIRYESMG